MTSGSPSAPIRVLFVCTHNSARSQIAEALLGRDKTFAAFSAGTEATRVNPFAIRVLADEGIDWSGALSKSVTEFLGEPFDYVITVCNQAQEACPVFPGATRTLHWDIDDPSKVEGTDDQKLTAFQRTSADISERLGTFVEAVHGPVAR